MAKDKVTGGYHTMNECKCKVSGVKTILKQIRNITRGHNGKENYTVWALADSAIAMCNELLVEGEQDDRRTPKEPTK